MKRIFSVVSVFAAVLGAASGLNAQRVADDEQAVRKVLRDVHATLSARDLKAFGQLFAEDAEFVNVSGVIREGPRGNHKNARQGC